MKKIEEMYNLLPRYLEVRDRLSRSKPGIFRLFIIKNEWDGHNDACIAGYTKEGERGFSKKNILFKVEGGNLCNAITQLYNLYIEIKPNYIQGKTFLLKKYIYDKTHRIDDVDGKKYPIITSDIVEGVPEHWLR